MSYFCNPRMSYLKKENCYVIYVQYNLYFLKGKAAQLFTKVLQQEENIPQSYLTFLKEKHILEKIA